MMRIGIKRVKRITSPQPKMSRYLSTVQNGHRAKLTTGYIHHHFILQAAADPTWSWLVGSGSRTHLAWVVVTPRVHLSTMINIYYLRFLQGRDQWGTLYLPIGCQGNRVVGATGHFYHSLTQKVSGHEGRGQAVVGGAIAQLAVAIVAPGKNLSIYSAVRSFGICCLSH